LRTPLMVASGYLQAIKKGMLSGEQLDTTLDTVVRNVDQITSLANDLLFMQEIELVLPEFQSVNIVEVAKQVLTKYEAKAQARNVSLKIKGENAISKILGDAQSLGRAITALVDNAIKFSAPHGEVELRFAEQKEHVLISVEDHGIGIDPEIRPRIFDRFFHLEKSGDELYSGIGIGLSITRQVILQHNGMLNVESTPGKGSKFTISLLKA